jgi:glutamine phosphoribosylpyrophosphate amidotransferase
MCSIIGSKSKEKLSQLAELNEYRGTHSHSLFVFNDENEVIYSHRGFGKLVVSDHPVIGAYYIAHQQAPTTESKSVQAIHPANVDGALLWHNGIIKADDIKRLQQLHETDEKWDTKLLLTHYMETSNLSDVDGTFACVMWKDYEFRIFRNEISPLFCNEQGDISSTKFENSSPIPANKVLTFDPSYVNMFNVVAEFTTKENPYYFM